jgi:hypothetical protein
MCLPGRENSQPDPLRPFNVGPPYRLQKANAVIPKWFRTVGVADHRDKPIDRLQNAIHSPGSQQDPSQPSSAEV